MNHVDFVFWSFLVCGCFVLVEKNRVSLAVLVSAISLVAIHFALDVDGLQRYLMRLGALFIFGVTAIKLRVFGTAALFLFLWATSMLMYVSNVQYWVIAVLLSVPASLIILGRSKNHPVKQSRVVSAVEIAEREMESVYMGLFYAAGMLPFLLILLRGAAH